MIKQAFLERRKKSRVQKITGKKSRTKVLSTQFSWKIRSVKHFDGEKFMPSYISFGAFKDNRRAVAWNVFIVINTWSRTHANINSENIETFQIICSEKENSKPITSKHTENIFLASSQAVVIMCGLCVYMSAFDWRRFYGTPNAIK